MEYLEDVKKYMRKGDIFVIAEIKNETIGFSRISERDGSYWIEEIYVRPNYRGKGYGRKLVEFLESVIKSRDISVYIMVLPQDREAFKFWIKMGYTMLNSIELAKDLKPTIRSGNTRIIEILGAPLDISRWKGEKYSELELEYLETLEKFYRNGGNQELFLKIVKRALETWLKER